MNLVSTLGGQEKKFPVGPKAPAKRQKKLRKNRHFTQN